MNAIFEIANENSIKFYLAGLATGSNFFGAISDQEKKRIASLVKVKHFILQAKNYSEAIEIKKSILAKDQKSAIPIDLTGVELINLDAGRATNLKNGLKKIYASHTKQLAESLHKNNMVTTNNFTVTIMPEIGEYAESLHDRIVIGDGFDPKTGLAIFIEEVIHNLIKNGAMDNFKNEDRLQPEFFEEVVVGFFLYNILTDLKLDKELIDSVVFGWRGGEREAHVKKLVESQK